MTNKQRGELEHTFKNNKKIILDPTFERIAKVESNLGRSLMQLANEIGQQRLSFYDTAVLLSTLSKPNPKRPTVDEVGKLLTEHGLLSVAPLLQGLIEKVLTGGRIVDDDDVDPPQGAN